MIPIPVEIDAMLSILNLPKEMGDNGIFKEHRTLVLEVVRSIVLPEHYTLAIHEDMTEEDPLLISFRFGFCFLMLQSTCEFLNLKTLGEGIVKTVGLARIPPFLIQPDFHLPSIPSFLDVRLPPVLHDKR